MRPLVLLCLVFPLAAQAGLLKCADSKGNVTYTNLPCARIGLREVAVIPPPPPPVLNTPARVPETARSVVEKDSAAPQTKDNASLQLMKSVQAGDDKCAKLNSAMGRIMDEMDAARRKGRADSNAAWNENLKKLQADKNRLGCF